MCGQPSKVTAATGLVARTVVHGLTSLMNLNLGLEEKDYGTLFSLSDYSDRVLIFEDIERTKIDIFDLLGFVNNLTEIDNISVILVASESDLKRKLGNEKVEYEKNKEKSIYQTVEYVPSNDGTINEILTEFDNGSKYSLAKDGLSETI